MLPGTSRTEVVMPASPRPAFRIAVCARAGGVSPSITNNTTNAASWRAIRKSSFGREITRFPAVGQLPSSAPRTHYVTSDRRKDPHLGLQPPLHASRPVLRRLDGDREPLQALSPRPARAIAVRDFAV